MLELSTHFPRTGLRRTSQTTCLVRHVCVLVLGKLLHPSPDSSSTTSPRCQPSTEVTARSGTCQGPWAASGNNAETAPPWGTCSPPSQPPGSIGITNTPGRSSICKASAHGHGWLSGLLLSPQRERGSRTQLCDSPGVLHGQVATCGAGRSTPQSRAPCLSLFCPKNHSPSTGRSWKR